MIHGINHISISVPDLQKALDFYCGVLGFEKVEQSSWKAGSAMSVNGGKVLGVAGTAGEAAHIKGSNLLIELFQFKECSPKPQDPERPVIDHGITHFCLAVKDLAQEYPRLKAAGVKFISEPVKLAPGLTTVYGRDPFGNIIDFEDAGGRADPVESALTTVKRRVSTLALGVVFLVAYLAFFLWQTPWLWNSPMSAADIDRYVASIERHAIMPAEEKAAFVRRVRDWAANDDGKPVMLVNLMRYKDKLGALPPEVRSEGVGSTPQEVNAYYESLVAPLALKRGEYPLIGGDSQARSLLVSDLDTVAWKRVVVMRAPSRRAFIEFMADPLYGPTVPYKMAAEDVVLIPIDAQMIVPDLRWLVGGLMIVVYLLILWRRAASTVKALTPVQRA